MKARHFLARLDEKKIVAEIAAAEKSTSGEIRVFISRREVADAVAQAEKHFEELGMTRTKLRNGVMLFFAPASRKFAVIGDRGIHEKCGAAFWQEVTREIGAHLRSENFTEAVVHGIRKLGALLAKEFPPLPDDRDELPNDIAHD